ncbi:hypothetical protein AFM12_14305 [Jiulongibacter sediminis]|uniref:Uncharacterized protein n=1 Tax=Jiulongibacter sediminis TaxID=1605367 RepID=A0A0P7BRG4_9BACT|nr:hypothetical protein AFM12_14305 [Jiulongibacter sediminis]TBX23441.1 hypothetical protein TK44_14315 [Jiulongibacter sediminis]
MMTFGIIGFSFSAGLFFHSVFFHNESPQITQKEKQIQLLPRDQATSDQKNTDTTQTLIQTHEP